MYIKWSGIPVGLLAARIEPSLNWKLCVLVASVLAYAVDRVVDHVYYTRKARKLGCGPSLLRKYKLPFAVDLVYNAIQADKRNEIPEYFNEQFHTVCGTRRTVEQGIFGTHNFFTVDPKNVQAILATQFNDFDLGETRRANFFPLLGNGIFTADGKFWEHSRAMLRPQFTRDQVSDLDVEESHVQDMFKHLPIGAHGWTDAVNVGPLFFRLTLDTATEFLFGQSVESQIAALPDTSIYKQSFEKKGGLDWEKMGRAFDDATDGLGKRARFNELYWLHSPKKFFDDCKEVHRFADYYVNLALTTDLYEAKGIGKNKDGKRAKYIFLAELVKATRDPIELRSQLLNILIAGRDTTAGLLGWTFWLLARHPDVFSRLRKTVLEDFGTYENPREITFATLKGCQYLQYTMNETLRLYPSVPINSRRSTRDTTIPRGGGPDDAMPLFVRKGQEVSYSVFMMHRLKELWGPDADLFRPDRWFGRKCGWEFLPFNGGPRICLGMSFALTEAGYVLVRMLQRFDRVENLDPSNTPKHQYSVTSAPLAVNLRLHRAS